MRCFTAGEIAAKFAVFDHIDALRGDAFVVIGKGAEAGAVGRASVGNDVYDRGCVSKIVQFVESKKTGTGKIGFLAENAIEFDRMAHGFVNLQAKLAAAEDQRGLSFGALSGGVEGNRLFRHL